MFFSLILLAGMASAAAPQIVVTRSRFTPEDDIVLAGATDQLVGAFRVRATGEPMALSEFTLTVHGDERAVELLTVWYYETDGDIAVSSAIVGPDGVVSFTAEDVLVPVDPARRALIVVYADLDDGTDATVGDSFRVDWTDTTVEATGIRSGDTYRAESVTDMVSGPLMVWHWSEPSFGRAVSSPSGAHTPGWQEALGVNATAAANGPVSFTGLVLDVHADDLSGSGFATCASLGVADAWGVYDAADPSTDLAEGGTWSFYDTDGTNCDIADPAAQVASARVAFAEEVAFAEGETRTLRAYADLAAGSGDAFRLDLVDVGWLDLNGDYSVTFDGNLLVGLPVAGGTLTF